MGSGLEIKLENTDFMKRAISELEKGVDDKTLNQIGQVMGEALGTYAPERTGTLRKSYKVITSKNEVFVTWKYSGSPARKYAHYQNEGIVYGPNHPIFRNNLFANEFESPKNKRKKKTKRKLGVRRTVVFDNGQVIFIDGYTKENSSAHWIDKARHDPEVYNPMRREVYERLADAIGVRIVGKRYYT